MNDRVLPHDDDAEAAVIGSILLAPQALGAMYRIGLKSEHFYRPKYRLMFNAITKLDDDGRAIDTLTVQARLAADGKLEEAGGDDAVAVAVAHVPNIANVSDYGEIVVNLAARRRYVRVADDLTEAAIKGDTEGIAKAERQLLTGMPTGRVTYQPDELGLMMIESFEKPAETFKTPWPKFNRIIAGGFRRGSLTVLSGYSSHGKSVVVDQILERAVEDGYKAHLWINEMTPTDRVARICARRGEIPLDHIVQGKLTLEDHKTLQGVLGNLPFGITDCAGWTAEEIARDIRAKRPDIAGVDIFQKIAGGQQVYELDEKSRVLNDVPKESQANCHVLLTAHVTKPSQRDGKPAKPNGSNLRGTGSLENDADYVVFVHREVNDNGRRGNDGWLYATKTRSGGQPGEIKVTFSGPHQKFTEFKAKKGANAIDDTQEFPF